MGSTALKLVLESTVLKLVLQSTVEISIGVTLSKLVIGGVNSVILLVDKFCVKTIGGANFGR